MKRIYSMAIFQLSILLLSGCGNQQTFHYEAEVAETEEEEEVTNVTETESLEYSDLNFDLNSDESFIVQDDKVSIYFIERSYSKYKIYFNTTYSGLCGLTMCIVYDSGAEEIIECPMINANYQHYFNLDLEGSSVKSITVSLEPVEGTYTDCKSFGGDIELLSDNTIKSHKNGTVELYDRYSTAINVLTVKKGETYVVNKGAEKYSLLYRR